MNPGGIFIFTDPFDPAGGYLLLTGRVDNPDRFDACLRGDERTQQRTLSGGAMGAARGAAIGAADRGAEGALAATCSANLKNTGS